MATLHPGPSLLVLSLLILMGAGRAADETVSCVYAARETEKNPTPERQELQPRGECATLRRDGSLTVHPDHLHALHFGDGLAAIFVPTGWYYVTPAGRTAPVLTYDNGPDYFAEGLARTHRSGKVGFIDHALAERIPPVWDFAFPFDGGVALVCQGCRSHPTEDGEHFEQRGGLWGYIDREGKAVVPVLFERERLPLPPVEE